MCVQCKHSNRNSAPVHTHSSGHNLSPLQISTELTLTLFFSLCVYVLRCFYVYLHFDLHPSFNKCNVLLSAFQLLSLLFIRFTNNTHTRKVSGFNSRKRVINLSWFRPIFPQHTTDVGFQVIFHRIYLKSIFYPHSAWYKPPSQPLIFSSSATDHLHWLHKTLRNFGAHENRIGNHSTVYLFNININENENSQI